MTAGIQAFLGILIFLSVPYLLSRSKGMVSIRFVSFGILSQFVFAGLLLKVPFLSEALLHLNRVVSVLQKSTDKAAQFMLGYVAGGPPPFQVIDPANNFIVAFHILPLILVVSALSALLFHFGVLTFIVRQFARLLTRVFRISGALGFGASASVFFGTIEAPLVIRPYLSKLSKSELLALITCSMSTVAGTVMVLYASVLSQILPDALTHILTASIISVPAALTLSHLLLPAAPMQQQPIVLPKSELTWIEVLLNAVQDGLQMIFSIVAIIIVLFAMVHLIDFTLLQIHSDLSLNTVMSYLLKPVMWLTGLNWQKAGAAAELMGLKIFLNEYVSFLQLAKSEVFSPDEVIGLVYSMCGFANLASCGIIIAGLTTILPERRREVVELTFSALLLGNLATLMTGCVIRIISLI